MQALDKNGKLGTRWRVVIAMLFTLCSYVVYGSVYCKYQVILGNEQDLWACSYFISLFLITETLSLSTATGHYLLRRVIMVFRRMSDLDPFC